MALNAASMKSTAAVGTFCSHLANVRTEGSDD